VQKGIKKTRFGVTERKGWQKFVDKNRKNKGKNRHRLLREKDNLPKDRKEKNKQKEKPPTQKKKVRKKKKMEKGFSFKT